MKVPFVYGPNDLRLVDIDEPSPGPGDVVLDVGTVGVCGSDIGYIRVGGLMKPAKAPFPIGHELSGTVSAIGSEVQSVAVGDRVVLNPLVNLIGNGGAEGGFAPKLLVRDVVSKPGSLLPLPDNVSLDIGALVEPLAVAAHGVARMAIKSEDQVAIFGAGPIGLASLLILSHLGLEDIVVFDPSPFRRDLATKLGARRALDPRSSPPHSALRALHGKTLHAGRPLPSTTHYIEASGAAVLPEIMSLARPRATIGILSLQKDPFMADFRIVMLKELTIVGALGYLDEFEGILAKLADATIDASLLVSHYFAGDEALQAIQAAANPGTSSKVLVRYGS